MARRCPECAAEMEDDGVHAWCVAAGCDFDGYAVVSTGKMLRGKSDVYPDESRRQAYAEITVSKPVDGRRTIPGTYADYSRCDYDELCSETREAIDAVLAAHTAGVMCEPTALMILRFLGLCDAAAVDLLAAERCEASQP